MALEVTDTNIAEYLSEKDVTVLDFWAPWCGPCRMLTPIIDELVGENEGSEKVNIGKVNVDENGETAMKYGIRGIPTLLFIKDGSVVDRMTGMRTKIEIQEKIDSLLS